MVVYLEQGADLHMSQLMPLPLTVSCFSKILTGFNLTYRQQHEINIIFIMVLAHPGWWRGTVVERRSLAGELSLSCARPAADG